MLTWEREACLFICKKDKYPIKRYLFAENNYVVKVPSIMDEEIGTTLIKGDYIM